MKNFNIQKFVLTAVLTALTCVAGIVIHIHSPLGYINLGDTFVIISGFLLGPLFGAFAGGVGSSLTDFFTGHPIYIVGTFVIKSLMAVCSSYSFNLFKKSFLGSIVSSIITELIMVFGYVLYEWVFMGIGYGAIYGIWANFVQASICIIVCIIIITVFKNNKFLSKYLDGGQFK